MSDQSQPQTALLPFQPATMTPAQLAAVSFLARYSGPTHHLHAYQLRLWFGWCESNGLDALVGIERAHIELYIRRLSDAGLMASLINTMMHGVRGYFRFAHIDGVTPSNPAVYARLPEVHCDETRTQGLDRLELIRFLQVAQTITIHHGALAYLLGINALRASEAAALRFEDYAETLRGHRVLHLVGKGNKPATMPVTVPVLRVLEACRGERTCGPANSATANRQASRPTRRLAHGPAHCPRRRDPQAHQPALPASRRDNKRPRCRCPPTRRTNACSSRRPPNHRALRPRERQPSTATASTSSPPTLLASSPGRASRRPRRRRRVGGSLRGENVPRSDYNRAGPRAPACRHVAGVGLWKGGTPSSSSYSLVSKTMTAGSASVVLSSFQWRSHVREIVISMKPWVMVES
jgi:integrase/recombinase XerD